jgi:cysteine-rich repeat protein
MFSKPVSLARNIFLCLALGGLFVGCSDDTTEGPKPDTAVNKDKGTTTDGLKTDKTTTDGSVGDAATDGTEIFVDCSTKADGFNCSASGEIGFICLDKLCKASVCGDKFVDATLGEDCDDGNQDSTDGCTGCHWVCKTDGNCDDKEACSGTETCDTTKHACVPGTPLTDSTACKMSSGADGVCHGGACGPAGCGNSVKDGTEECDDGNQVEGDGCNNDCTFSCHADADCLDADACNGAETCDKTAGTKQLCKAGTAPDCDDKQTCTTDTCDAMLGCLNTPIDADGDGHSCADDCNEADATIYVGAPECVDAKDNNCNGKTDEAPTVANTTCYADGDKDNYSYAGATTSTVFCGAACPTGTTATDPNVAGQKDCGPCVGDAHPNQLSWYTNGYCPNTNCKTLCLKGSLKFDYNCDGVDTQQYQKIYSGCSKFSIFCSGDGWVTSVPACGTAGTWRDCSYSSALDKCLIADSARTQACH